MYVDPWQVLCYLFIFLYYFLLYLFILLFAYLYIYFCFCLNRFIIDYLQCCIVKKNQILEY